MKFKLFAGALLSVCALLRLAPSASAQAALPDDALYAPDRAAAEQPFDRAAFAAAFSHHKATVDGIPIHYVVGGRGTPLLLLHGWPETWYSWRRAMPALAKHYTVVAVDMPGFGDSQAAPSADKKTVARFLHALMTQLGYRKIFLAGHDMGGPVAYAYATAYPQEVQKLLLMETAIPGFGFADGSGDDILKITPQSVSGVWHFPFFMNPDMAEMLVRGHEREFVAAMSKNSYHNPSAFSSDELDELTRWLTAPGGFRSGIAYYQALFVDAQQNRVSGKTKLTMPVFVLCGDDGFLKNVTAKSVSEVATDVRSAVVPKSGHFIAEERPGYLAAQMIGFFGSDAGTP